MRTEHFDFSTVEEDIFSSKIATNEPVTVKERERKMCRLVIIESGLRLRRMRNGYEKRNQ
jgi:hypothetical protein